MPADSSRTAFNSVLSLTVQPYVGQVANLSGNVEPSVVAVRIIAARAAAAAAVRRVLGGLSQAAHDMRFDLQWRNSGGDPVAMICLPTDHDGQIVQIETLRLGDGEVYLAGRTEPRKP